MHIMLAIEMGHLMKIIQEILSDCVRPTMVCRFCFHNEVISVETLMIICCRKEHLSILP